MHVYIVYMYLHTEAWTDHVPVNLVAGLIWNVIKYILYFQLKLQA